MQSLLQTKVWADFKSRWGWQVYQLDPPASGTGQSGPLFVLGRSLAAGKSMLYSPEVALGDLSISTFKTLADQAKKLDNSAIFYRLELFEPLGQTNNIDNSTVAALTKAGYRKAFEETQPEYRQWVNIGADEATILANMKEKGRYNVRLAERKGVTTRVSTNTSDIDVFYRLFQVTAKRDGFKIRVKAYFTDLCQTLFANNLGELVIAEYHNQPLVALIVTYYDGLASYLYGASSSTERQLMAPYAAHWTAIQAAKSRDCQHYDLLQIAPPNADVRGASEASADDNHPYASLTRFKQQFGGQRVDLVGGWDFVYQPFWYQAFKIAEQVRR